MSIRHFNQFNRAAVAGEPVPDPCAVKPDAPARKPRTVKAKKPKAKGATRG